MGIDQITDIFSDTVHVTLLVAGPLMAVAMISGLLVSIFQAATQVNEQTLTFVPKIVLVLLTFVHLFPWMMRTIMEFGMRLLEQVAQRGGP
jgi:flagellar biosynthetic protein FliQ